MLVSESHDLTEDDQELVRRALAPCPFGPEVRTTVLVGRLQRALLQCAPSMAARHALRVDGRMGPRTREVFALARTSLAGEPIELGPELTALLEPPAVPEPPPTADALDDAPPSSRPGGGP